MPEETTKQENQNDTLAFIIGGIFILGLVFATYNYFKNQNPNTIEGDKQERQLSLEKLKETLSASTDETPEEDSQTEEQTNMEPQEQVDETGDVTDETAAWTPNDYSEGDIQTGDYSVQSGDTLWEIAEAVYGDGTMWTKIRDANSGSIDYLPNGQQALIYAGQTLTIPA